jgi:hypothetical protein
VIRLRHEGTQILPAGVNRECLKFAGICLGNEGKVSAALVKAVTGDRSKLTNRMIPFLNSPLVTLQNKLVILQWDFQKAVNSPLRSPLSQCPASRS